eukprot:3733277-Amphidinium_carterae.1
MSNWSAALAMKNVCSWCNAAAFVPCTMDVLARKITTRCAMFPFVVPGQPYLRRSVALVEPVGVEVVVVVEVVGFVEVVGCGSASAAQKRRRNRCHSHRSAAPGYCDLLSRLRRVPTAVAAFCCCLLRRAASVG